MRLEGIAALINTRRAFNGAIDAAKTQPEARDQPCSSSTRISTAVFGSGYPFGEPGMQLQRLMSAGFSDAQLERICAENIMRLIAKG